MTSGLHIDAVLVQWGDRLFYPPNRIVKSTPPARLTGSTQRNAAVIRRRIAATVSRHAPQVMVKVTGGGRGMAAIAAHFRYISKNGHLAIEDERGVRAEGKEAMHNLLDQWRFGGSRIEDVSPRREAFNIMLSMPQGTDADIVRRAAREFAQAEFKDHSYAMVLHDHQANPHVHLAVRSESRSGVRLNPRKADLHRLRETFAEKLRGWGIEAEATRQATRGATRRADPLWQRKARDDGRLQPAAREGRQVRGAPPREPQGRGGGVGADFECARRVGRSRRPQVVGGHQALRSRVMRIVGWTVGGDVASGPQGSRAAAATSRRSVRKPPSP